MKKIWTLLSAFAIANAAHAQRSDTLNNHPSSVTLQAGKYTAPGTWGFVAGHNSKAQQQFGEKYLVDEHVHVLGVIAHLNTTTGSVVNPATVLDFRLWHADAATGKPAGNTSAGEGHVTLGNVNLGSATPVLFPNEVHVENAFFVSLDLGDYAHDGLSGDTIGLYYAPHGSRTNADITATPFRNVFQAHSHGAPLWKDFYTQFTTPSAIATHFAVYPIVAFEDNPTSVSKVGQNGLEIAAPFPNPATSKVTIPLTLKKETALSFRVMDISGRTMLVSDKGRIAAGSHREEIDLSALLTGIYNVAVLTDYGAVSVRIAKVN